MQIVYKDENAVIVNKPTGTPSQPDPSGTPDALTLTAELLRSLGESDSLYPVHRLDLVVGGLLLFARTKRAAAALSELVASDGIGKIYLAVTDGEIAAARMVDWLKKDSVRSVAVAAKPDTKGAKEAILELSPIAVKDTARGKKQLSKIALLTGRFHQIRAQLSLRGTPITGDKKYSSRDSHAKAPALFSHALSFKLFGKEISARALPDQTVYPWSEFASLSEVEI